MNSLTTHMNKESNTNFLEVLLKYWPIIVTVALMIVGYATLQVNYVNLERKTESNSDQIAILQASVIKANSNHAEVAGDIKAINAKLDIIIKHSGL